MRLARVEEGVRQMLEELVCTTSGCSPLEATRVLDVYGLKMIHIRDQLSRIDRLEKSPTKLVEVNKRLTEEAKQQSVLITGHKTIMDKNAKDLKNLTDALNVLENDFIQTKTRPPDASTPKGCILNSEIFFSPSSISQDSEHIPILNLPFMTFSYAQIDPSKQQSIERPKPQKVSFPSFVPCRFHLCLHHNLRSACLAIRGDE